MNEYDWDKINEAANNKVDILSLIEEYQDPARTNGSKVLFHCCNNSDSTPSLVVDTKDNYYKCFSCGSGGNALTYLIKERKMPYKEAVDVICRFADVKDLVLRPISDGIKFFKQMKKRVYPSTHNNPERVYIDYADYLKYTKEYPEEWVNEGIEPEIMDLFDVRIDHKSNRIVYPVYDANGRFITAKGRTRFEKYKVLGISKYINYSKVGIVDFFAGMEITRPYIEKEKRIIITEGIKSVYKLFGWGYKYCGAAETSAINEYQVRLLISMRLEEVIIAFDADKDLAKIIESVSLLRRFTKVSIIYDKDKLIGDKEAPVDRGLDIFNKLLSKRTAL